MTESATESRILNDLCNDQQLAVLATNSGSGPYTSLVAFAAAPDRHSFYFITPRSTRKWANLEKSNQVSLLIDNRDNTIADFSRAAAATLLGSVVELQGKEKAAALALYLVKHPHLQDFASAPDCALLQVKVASIYLVTRFQNVVEYHFSG